MAYNVKLWFKFGNKSIQITYGNTPDRHRSSTVGMSNVNSWTQKLLIRESETSKRDSFFQEMINYRILTPIWSTHALRDNQQHLKSYLGQWSFFVNFWTRKLLIPIHQETFILLSNDHYIIIEHQYCRHRPCRANGEIFNQISVWGIL